MRVILNVTLLDLNDIRTKFFFNIQSRNNKTYIVDGTRKQWTATQKRALSQKALQTNKVRHDVTLRATFYHNERRSFTSSINTEMAPRDDY